MKDVLRILWLAFPVMLAAAVHIVVLRLRLFESLKRPLDGGRCLRGRRLFGDNKTVRGAVVMVAVAIGGAMLQGVVRVPSCELFDYAKANLPGVGLLLGLGFVLGELPNSFLKRQWDIGPGQRGPWFFVILDQVDSVAGALAMLAFTWPAPLRIWVIALVLCSGVHILFNSVFVLVGLKKSVF